MPRVSEAEIRASLDRVAEILRDQPDGLSRSVINDAHEESHGTRLSARTLNRRLQRLEGEGRLTPLGTGRARRYVLARASIEELPADEETAPGPATVSEETEEVGIPLSPEGLELRRWVGRPLQQREPCTYRRQFLDDYVPGETWYLPEETRKELWAAGQTPDPERPAGTYARDILDRLLIDLSWASSRLEGNTYSRLDTQNLLELGIHAEDKSREEAQMILNHRNAIRMLVDNVTAVGFDRRTLLSLHAALSENLVANPGEEGALRRRAVQISGTVYTPIAIPQVIRESFDLLLDKVREIPDPFEQAFFAMVHIPYLQPFIDVNKRTSRLAANISFIKGNLCPLSFVAVPNETYVEATIAVYEKQGIGLLRDLFVWAYRRSCQEYRVVREALGEPDAIRFRYREHLTELVRETVQTRTPLRTRDLKEWAEARAIEPEDRDAFAERAMDLLLNLSEGALGRYGLTPDDVDAWRVSVRPMGTTAPPTEPISPGPAGKPMGTIEAEGQGFEP
jgi:hypothetical protein